MPIPNAERTVVDIRKLRDLGRRDTYGQRYIIDFPLEWRGKRPLIRSGWIIEHGIDIPRLTTCYPL